MAKPYKEGKGWCIRTQYKGLEYYQSGFATAKAAEKAERTWKGQVDKAGKPHADGPDKTHLAQALQDYALERLPFLKGAEQDARRINTYLRLAGLATIALKPVAAPAPKKDGEAADTVYFDVWLEAATEARRIPKGLSGHRKALLTKTARTEQHRRFLSTRWMSEITRQDLQALVCAMRRDRIAPATIQQEKALLSVLFNHARKIWRWASLTNQASGLKLPKVKNERNRVLSKNEQQLLEEALADCRNKFAPACITLLRETAMRASEPIDNAQWQHVDWERRVIRLPDSKDGGREVPLSPKAIAALKELRAAHAPEQPVPTDPIICITYESLKAAWRRACDRAGITNLRLHDLRHTAATRLALASGNLFLVKALTGHKTLKMVERYVNVNADDVVDFLHAWDSDEPAVEPLVEGEKTDSSTSYEQPAGGQPVAAQSSLQPAATTSPGEMMVPMSLVHEIAAKAAAEALARVAPVLAGAAGAQLTTGEVAQQVRSTLKAGDERAGHAANDTSRAVSIGGAAAA